MHVYKVTRSLTWQSIRRRALILAHNVLTRLIDAVSIFNIALSYFAYQHIHFMLASISLRFKIYQNIQAYFINDLEEAEHNPARKPYQTLSSPILTKLRAMKVLPTLYFDVISNKTVRLGLSCVHVRIERICISLGTRVTTLSINSGP